LQFPQEHRSAAFRLQRRLKCEPSCSEGFVFVELRAADLCTVRRKHRANIE
jgi:hypothetical protein